MPQTIRTILHLSDLHIGDIDPVKGISRSNRAANLNITQFFPGNLGHDQRSVQAVADLWRSISDQGDADLVITGDLTAFGSSTITQTPVTSSTMAWPFRASGRFSVCTRAEREAELSPETTITSRGFRSRGAERRRT